MVAGPKRRSVFGIDFGVPKSEARLLAVTLWDLEIEAGNGPIFRGRRGTLLAWPSRARRRQGVGALAAASAASAGRSAVAGARVLGALPPPVALLAALVAALAGWLTAGCCRRGAGARAATVVQGPPRAAVQVQTAAGSPEVRRARFALTALRLLAARRRWHAHGVRVRVVADRRRAAGGRASGARRRRA